MRNYRPIRGWKPTTPSITSSNYEAVFIAHQYVAIHFWAEWNGVDPPLDRELGRLPSEVRALVQFVSCDTDDPENEVLIQLFSLLTVPALGLLVNGKPRDLIVGLRTSESLAMELINRFPLPTTINPSEKQVEKSALAGMLDWIRLRFRPRGNGRT